MSAGLLLACCIVVVLLIPTAASAAATFGGGFEVSVMSGNVEARVVEAGLESGMELFYFDTPDQPEVLVKLLDREWWVAIAAATDRPLEVIVRCSPTGSVKRYPFVAGHSSLSLLDTGAFPNGCGSRSTATAAAEARPTTESSADGASERVVGNATLRNRFLTGISFTAPDGEFAANAMDLPGDNAVLFWFFDPTNPDVLFRVVDGCAENGHWWVFMSAVSSLPREATVQDVSTGYVRRYPLASGSYAGVADRTAFPCDGGPPTPHPPAGTSVTLHDRFVAGIEFTAHGERRAAQVVDVDLPGAASALFHFGNPANAEILFKVLEGCKINEQWWVFAAAATDLAYRITVRDLRTRTEKTWFAEPGGSPPLTDTYAFPCS